MTEASRWPRMLVPPQWTLRTRLTAWYLVLLAAILIALGAFLYVSLGRALRAEIDRSLEAVADQAVAALDAEIDQAAPLLGAEGDHTLLGDVPPGPSAAVVALYDPTGRQILDVRSASKSGSLIAAMGALPPTSGLRAIGLRDGDGWRVLTRPVRRDGRVVAILRVARSDQDVEAALRQLLLLLVVTIPTTLLLATAGGLFLAGRALDPIDRITRAAEQIGAEDLSRRLGIAGDDEVGRLAGTFDRMLDRLDRAFQRQRQFVADASHELRTPLAMLTSRIDVTLSRPRSAMTYRQALESVGADAQRMAQLVGELLMLARADAGQEVLDRERIDIAELAAEVVRAMAPLADARSVRLVLATSPPADVVGDQTRLTQLLINLIDNAVKHTPPEGVVKLSVSRETQSVVLEVADTGVGIAPEALPHVFDRFYRADSARARETGGMGLGLAISRWIVEAHGGQISVRSEPGRGATFSVRLPADLPT